jgi:hypothetical protein
MEHGCDRADLVGWTQPMGRRVGSLRWLHATITPELDARSQRAGNSYIIPANALGAGGGWWHDACKVSRRHLPMLVPFCLTYALRPVAFLLWGESREPRIHSAICRVIARPSAPGARAFLSALQAGAVADCISYGASPGTAESPARPITPALTVPAFPTGIPK